MFRLRGVACAASGGAGGDASLASGLAVVVPLAERFEVVVAVVVVRDDVVDVGRGGAARALGVLADVSAPVPVADEDSDASDGPVRGEARAPVGALPVRDDVLLREPGHGSQVAGAWCSVPAGAGAARGDEV